MSQNERSLNQGNFGRAAAHDEDEDDQEEALKPMFIRSSRIQINIRTKDRNMADMFVKVFDIPHGDDLTEETAIEINNMRRQAMDAEGKAELRENMGDRGHPIFGFKMDDDTYEQREIGMIKLDCFVEDIVENGYAFIGATWRFEPSMRNGKPGKDRVCLRFDFSREKSDLPANPVDLDILREDLEDLGTVDQADLEGHMVKTDLLKSIAHLEAKFKHLDDLLEGLKVITRSVVFSNGFSFENEFSADTVNVNAPQPTKFGAAHNVMRFAPHDDAIVWRTERINGTEEMQDNNYRIAKCHNPDKRADIQSSEQESPALDAPHEPAKLSAPNQNRKILLLGPTKKQGQ